MSVQEVINKMPSVPTQNYTLSLSNIAWLLYIIITLIFIIIIFIALNKELIANKTTPKDQKRRRKYIYHFIVYSLMSSIATYMLVSLIYNYALLENKTSDYEVNKQKWKTDIVLPYIQSLPDSKSVIVDMQTHKDLPLAYYLGDYSLNSQKTKVDTTSNLNKKPITITYIQNNIQTSTDYFNIVMDLKPNERPYFISKYLDQNINDTFDAGNYYGTIHTPVDYKFIINE